MNKFLSLSICVMLSGIIFAQTPQSFQYQSVVRDASGAVLVSQPVTLKLSIIAGALPGIIEYVETHSTTTNAFGVVTLAVGSGTPVTNLFLNIDWSNAIHHLKVEVNLGSGYIDMGTTQLLSVPYALYSESSGDSHWSINGNDIYNSNSGNVGVGINNPIGRMVVQGSSTALPTDPLFEIKNRIGQSIMVVYEDSVHFFITDAANPSNKGGFAVSGRSNAKAVTNDYLKVRPDSTRIWTGDSIAGFGVKNIGATSKTSYMQLTPKNYFIGHEAGKSITPAGEYNSFIGYQSGYKNTVGDKNYFIGYKSGYSNLSGSNNIFVGDSSGYSNTTGKLNLFIGNKAGYINTTGNSNVFLGYNAGYTNNGDYNVFLGYESGRNNINGTQNCFIGYQSGFNSDSTIYNTFVGYQSGFSTISGGGTNGKYNAYFGCKAGRNNTYGFHNCFYGNISGYNNSTGSRNSFYGNSSGFANTTGSYNSFIGASCGQSNTTGTQNTFLGFFSGFSNVSGGSNVYIGYDAAHDALGSNNTIIGSLSDVSTNTFTNVLSLGYQAIATASNQVRLGNSNIASIYCQGAYVARAGGTYQTLSVWSDGQIAYLSSSRRYKESINDMEEVGWLYKLRPVNFKYISDPDKVKQYGLIAEEVELVNKKFVFYKDGLAEGVNYSDLVAPMLKAIQDQKKEIEELKASVQILKSENSEWKLNFEHLKADNK